MKYEAERAEVIKYAVEMEERGLTVGTSGNVSCRVPEGAIITPSTIPYKEIKLEDCCLLDLDGGVLEGEKIASVEHKVHLECYKARADVGAVIHAHPTVASAFAAARVELPSFLDEMGVYVGDAVRVAEYAMSGSPEIAKYAVEAMGETANAVFLASHGMVCVGRDLAGAMHVAKQVERAAQIWIFTQMLGGPADLPEESKTLFAQVFEYYRTR
jgi:L-fuculose-phosphate aldolase